MVVESGRTVRLGLGLGVVTALLLTGAAPIWAGPTSAPGVVRGGNTWLLRDSLTGGPATTTFTYGSPGDGIHVTGDWDGNGTRTPGIVRIQGEFAASHYVWFLRNSNTAGVADVPPFAYGKPSFGFEEPGDTPVVGDWNGDGVDTVGVVRRRNAQSTALWLLRNTNTGGAADVEFGYGLVTDIPAVAGDWNGDGTDTPGVIRNLGQGTLTWLLRNANSSGPAQIQLGYGRGFDEAVVGDWDGDGVDGVGVVRTVGGNLSWLLRNTLTSGPAQLTFGYGRTGDRPVVWQ